MTEIFVGIDLGSTTTKAVVLDGDGEVIGRGITNSRSNYDIAARIVRDEALVRTRFTLIERHVAVSADAPPAPAGRPPAPPGTTGQTTSSPTTRPVSVPPGPEASGASLVAALESNFKLQQHLDQLDRLHEAMLMIAAGPKHAAHVLELRARLEAIHGDMLARARTTRANGFFRDAATADFMHLAEAFAEPKGVTFDLLCGVFDAAILSVEAVPLERTFERHIGRALEETSADHGLAAAVEFARSARLVEAGTVGTGYGRQRLPFPKEQTRSEILCHGLGAHAMFPETRTVLDIGGQDTKAIQLDPTGLVTSFQMNDRCAAGCGRYLGYIADEMNLAVQELGPLAQKSRHRVKINSTCTVFAGAELRERLSLGQKREDIVAGLHRAIVIRAMSLLARSGGISDQFTFTGGVARNSAAVDALMALIGENYGARTVNISAESIYTGALGAALPARKAA